MRFGPILCRAIAALFILCSLSLTAAAQTRLWIQSEAGDYIGAGVTQTYTSPANAFTVSSNQGYLSVQVGGWWLEVTPKPGGILAAGPYENAARYPFQGSSPGLDFSGNGRGCNTLTGRFVILAVSYDRAGNLGSLAMDFEQHCEGGTAALWGELRINSAVPLTLERPAGWTRPDNFDFGGFLAVLPSTQFTSLPTTIYGIKAPAAITVSGGEYSINGGTFRSTPGTVNNRDRVRARATSSATPGETATATVTVGGEVYGSFSLTTYLAGDVQTGLVFESPSGDWVGAGESGFWFTPDWALSLSGTNYLEFSGSGPLGRRFWLDLTGPSSTPLAPGAYENAQRAAFAGVSPGLDLSMDSRGCNTLRGRFAVLEIDLTATPPRLAVDFEQSCDGGPPLFGELRYNSTIPYNFQVTAADSQPDAMAFAGDSPVRPNSMVLSNYSRIYGTNAPVPISITGGGEYSINDGPFTSSPGTAQELDRIRLRMKAASAPGATRQTTLNAGGRTATFSVRTYGPGTPITAVYLRSTPGDYVGAGQTLFFPSPPNSVTVSGTGASANLSIDGYDGHWFFASFAPPSGTTLAVGTYENAARFNTPTQPEVDFGGDGRGCNQTGGRFVVHEVQYGAGGAIQKLALDFEQRCEISGPPLYGQVRFNSSVPVGIYLAPNKPQDASGEGRDDLVWQHTDGRVAMWLMNGFSPTSGAEIIGPGTGWSVTHLADFNADGKVDLVWQHPDGRAAIWLMDGTTPIEMRQILNAGDGWTITHTADLNGDGKADLLFSHTDGRAAAWMMDGTAATGSAELTKPPPQSGWSVARTADFDGDGKADLVWMHAHGNVVVWLMDGLAMKSSTQILGPDTGWSLTDVGDLDGDGRADIVWRHSDGQIAAWLMNGAALKSGATLLAAGTGWQVKRLADFDGDGLMDLFFEHTDGRAAIWTMNGLTPRAQSQILNAGSGWRLARTADLDGDGRADILWRHTDGRVAAWLMFGGSMASGSGILGAGSGWSISTAP
jgi:VCBS repeat protein